MVHEIAEPELLGKVRITQTVQVSNDEYVTLSVECPTDEFFGQKRVPYPPEAEEGQSVTGKIVEMFQKEFNAWYDEYAPDRPYGPDGG